VSHAAPRKRPAPAIAARRAAVRVLRAVRTLRGHQPEGPGAPPRVPEGWTTGPPDWVGVGAAHAGTSWWSSCIHAHPNVHRVTGRPEALHFFDAGWERRFGRGEAAGYARYFPRPAGGVAGEWTSSYMVDFWTPALIRQAAPEARILVLLRDPLECYRASMSATGHDRRARAGRNDASGAFGRGRYAQQLRRLFDAFPREQVLVLQYERCREAPQVELARTFGFLGLPPLDVAPAVLDGPVEGPDLPRHDLEPDLRLALARAYRSDLEGLRDLAPGIDLDRWPTWTVARRG
jgi:hypothetical protein